MSVLNGLGMQEDANIYTRPYDHPYFSQLFLGAIFATVGFPDTVEQKSGDLNTIKVLYLAPRILMGLLAVADTFLIYKISDRLYNRKVAFIASFLFAASPTIWLFRRVWLEPIQLPLILLSILFVIYFKDIKAHENENNYPSAGYILLTISGTFLGLAIFTKIPAITMIPLVSFLVFKNSGKSIKNILLWLTPVVLIPLIWPINAFFIAESDYWLKGFLWQAMERPDRPLSLAFDTLLRIDGILVIIGLIGTIFIAIRNKDFVLALWILPLLIFFQLLGYVSYWFFIPILPALCIGAAKLIDELTGRVKNEKLQSMLLFFGLASLIIIGLISTISLLIIDVNSGYLEGVTVVVKYITSPSIVMSNDDVTLVGSRWVPSFSWILDYIFSKGIEYRQFQKEIFPLSTDKIILIVDRDLLRYLEDKYKDINELEKILSETHVITILEENKIPKESRIISNLVKYPNRSLVLNTAVRIIEIRANY